MGWLEFCSTRPKLNLQSHSLGERSTLKLVYTLPLPTHHHHPILEHFQMGQGSEIWHKPYFTIMKRFMQKKVSNPYPPSPPPMKNMYLFYHFHQTRARSFKQFAMPFSQLFVAFLCFLLFLFCLKFPINLQLIYHTNFQTLLLGLVCMPLIKGKLQMRKQNSSKIWALVNCSAQPKGES